MESGADRLIGSARNPGENAAAGQEFYGSMSKSLRAAARKTFSYVPRHRDGAPQATRSESNGITANSALLSLFLLPRRPPLFE